MVVFGPRQISGLAKKVGKVTPDRDGCHIAPLVVLSHTGQYNFLYPSEIIKILKYENKTNCLIYNSLNIIHDINSVAGFVDCLSQ